MPRTALRPTGLVTTAIAIHDNKIIKGAVFQMLPEFRPLIAVQERGAGAGGGRQESKVDAHDDHDEGQFGAAFMLEQ